MKLDLFNKGDTILLVGEGNFTFAVSLRKLNLPIEIVATCLEPEIVGLSQKENIDYLESHEVPVFLDVDASKLHEHPHVTERKYTKIIFNFPHVGGKMKIQLNRELLKKTFESAKHLLQSDGLMVVSLCRGQGGTPADEPLRRWDDSWQISEMAAHGNFILTAVEPFVKSNFKEYECTGYRSQDVQFNLEGALVHIFSKRTPPYKSLDNNETVKQRLSLNPLDDGKNSNVMVPVLYSDLYSENPLSNTKSAMSFFLDSFLKEMTFNNKGPQVKVVTDEEIPVFVTSERGVICQVKGLEGVFKLRLSAIQILNNAITLLENFDGLQGGLLLFPGMYFNPLNGTDFLTDPPISYQFLLLGKNASTYGYRFIYNLTKLFQRTNIACSLRPQNQWGAGTPHPTETIQVLASKDNIFEGKIATEWVYSHLDSSTKEDVVSQVYTLSYKNCALDACLLYPDKLAEIFFGIETWRELWADRNEVQTEAVVENVERPRAPPVLKQSLLYPMTYEFDVTLKYSMKIGLSESRMYQVLWLSAGHLIQNVELLSEYHSEKGWSSKCYRITYKSLDKPLYRSRVVDIHANVVSKMLSVVLKFIEPDEMNIIKVVVRLNTLFPPLFAKLSKSQVTFYSTRQDKPIALRNMKKKSKNLRHQFFVDSQIVEAVGGKGGNGCISFLSMWANECAGPDGGDGGNGGHVIFQASTEVTDLSHLTARIGGAEGEKGGTRDCSGKSAKHTVVPVPLGTVIKTSSDEVVADLEKVGVMFIAARGGAGGHGNHFFASSTMQMPEIAELGGEGESRRYIVEVKSIAHIGLVGVPNAGKSTLLSAISRARPEVSSAPFTTLRPQLGVVQYTDYEQIAVADLPGLIEGSHQNKGLGIQFLKHTERCAGLLYVVDASEDEPWLQVDVLRSELEAFSKELSLRPALVAANKIDLPQAQENLKEFRAKVSLPVIEISAKTGKNLSTLLEHIRRLYDERLSASKQTGEEND